MTGAELLVRCLDNEGLQHMFGVPGEENIAVLEAILDSNIHFLQTRHEQGAAFMADVQGRLTGKASVCLATLGPGATNLLTGVADANMDRAPLVAITAQAGTERFHKESHQYLDLISLYRPVVETFMGKGSLPDAHPLCLGTVGLQERDYASCGLDQADVIICVGYDLVEYARDRWNPRREKRIVHIDPSPAEVDAAYQVAVGVQGSVAESLMRIAERTSARGDSRAIRDAGALREIIQKEFRAEAEGDSFPLKPQRVVRALRDVLGDNDVLISDVGAHKL